MNKKSIALVSSLVLAGCASSITPNYDLRFGEAVRASRSQMALNPTPSQDPVAGVDGRAAREAQTRYQNTFKEPPPVVNVINIGGAIAGGR